MSTPDTRIPADGAFMIRRILIVLAGMLALTGCTGTGSISRAPEPVAKARHVLLLTHNTFYNHDNLASIEAALPEWGKTAGFDVTSLEGYKQTARCTREQPCSPDVVDLSMIDASYLAHFDAIVMSTNGELPFTDQGKQALVEFVRNGKGILFLHQSMVTLYGFKPWGEMLGAYSGKLPSFDQMNLQKRMAILKVEDRTHPATRNLPEHWQLNDEFAQFPRNVWNQAAPTENLGPTGLPIPLEFSRARVTVVLSFDTDRTDFTGAPASWNKGGDYPVAWYQHLGEGRTFYTSLGHRNDLWTSDPMFRAHITGALRWVLGLEN